MFVPEVAPLRCIYTLELGRVIESSWFPLLWEYPAAKASAQHAVTSSACPSVCLLSASAVQRSLGAVIVQDAGASHLYTSLHMCFTLGWHYLLDGVILLDHVSMPACFDKKGVELLIQSNAVCPHSVLYRPSYPVLSRHRIWCLMPGKSSSRMKEKFRSSGLRFGILTV